MAEVSTLPVILKTSTSYAIPSEKYVIPTSFRRFHLSQLINKVLSLPNPIPFDFLVRGQLLSGSLSEWCAENGVGEEETLEIEYVQSILPPQRMTALPHPDWVSSVSCAWKGYFLTGSYDAHLRVVDETQTIIHDIAVHDGPISSLCFASAVDDIDNMIVASASYDTTARLTRFPSSPNPTSNKPNHLATLVVHTAPLTSIAANSSNTQLITGSRDKLIAVWDTTIPDTSETQPSEARNKKRRKLDESAETTTPKTKNPIAVLKSHTGAVSRALFSPVSGESSKAWSCGWDFTLRSWDVSTGLCTSTITAAEKVLLDMALTADGQSIVAASSDRSVLVYPSNLSSSFTQNPHRLPHASQPVAVISHPVSPNHILSASQDGVVRLWDLRSHTTALEEFLPDHGKGKAEARAKKITCLDWGLNGLVGIGGEGGLSIWNAPINNS